MLTCLIIFNIEKFQSWVKFTTSWQFWLQYCDYPYIARLSNFCTLLKTLKFKILRYFGLFDNIKFLDKYAFNLNMGDYVTNVGDKVLKKVSKFDVFLFSQILLKIHVRPIILFFWLSWHPAVVTSLFRFA